MALSAEQQVIVAEIIEKPRSYVQSKTLSDAEILWLSDDLDVWAEKRNKVAVELNGEVDYKIQRLLDKIRERVRVLYGLPRYSDDITGPGSFAIPNVPVF